MSKKGKIFQKLIARLFTAVFLFVVIASTVSPVLPVYAGDDVSGNEAEDEFDWETYLEDDDEKEELIHNLAEYYAALYVSYTDAIGNSWDDIQDVVDPNHNLTDASWGDKFTAIVDYVSPFCQTYVEEYAPNTSIAPSRPSTSHSNSHHNDSNFLTDLVRDMGQEMGNLVPGADSVFIELPNDVGTGSTEYISDIFPSWFIFSLVPLKDCIPNHPDPYEYEPLKTTMFAWMEWESYGANAYRYKVLHNLGDNGIFTYRISSDGPEFYPEFASNCDAKEWLNYRLKNGNWINSYGNPSDVSGWYSQNRYYSYIKISGNTYIHNTNNSRWYYWDQTTCTLYDLGLYSDFDNANNSGNATTIYKYTTNVNNSVDFNSYNELVSDVLNQVTENYQITNQLISELFELIAQQNNNFVPEDGDDINDFIRDLQDRLQRSIELNLTVPDITPDLSGIANAIGAIFNFLSSIISAIGNIVSSLLDGLFHLFVPSDEDWDDITIEFDKLTSPLSWIGGFIGEASSSVSLLLFGRNTVDFASVEDEVQNAEVDLYESGSPSEHSQSHHTGIETGIVYDPDCGAPKIPVHFSNSSSDYFRNIEDAYIIDLSWYAPFKPVGDIIVVAFCWILFIWRVLHDLPGIINGASGITDNGAYSDSQELRKVSTWNGIFHR